jgi:hypothetical protein
MIPITTIHEKRRLFVCVCECVCVCVCVSVSVCVCCVLVRETETLVKTLQHFPVFLLFTQDMRNKKTI